MIPANIDYLTIIEDLKRWGVSEHKVELICGFASGYVHHLKKGAYRDMTYQRAARLYNFWFEESTARHDSQSTENNQCLALTT